jgi:hypothetical protein
MIDPSGVIARLDGQAKPIGAHEIATPAMTALRQVN